MKKEKIYWKDYYENNNKNFLLNSKLDRSRYYLNSKYVSKSIIALKKNINAIDKKIIKNFLNTRLKKDYLRYYKKNLSNFDQIKLIFLSKSLQKYYEACGYRCG